MPQNFADIWQRDKQIRKLFSGLTSKKLAKRKVKEKKLEQFPTFYDDFVTVSAHELIYHPREFLKHIQMTNKANYIMILCAEQGSRKPIHHTYAFPL